LSDKIISLYYQSVEIKTLAELAAHDKEMAKLIEFYRLLGCYAA
jgi:hypothetical protein